MNYQWLYEEYKMDCLWEGREPVSFAEWLSKGGCC